MRAEVIIEKTFDDGGKFTKKWEDGDFCRFFEDEGDYLDSLCGILKDKGHKGDRFRVTYTVEVEK